MSITARKGLAPGDVLFACTDGFWSGLTDAEIVRGVHAQSKPLDEALRVLAETAVSNNAPHSDNTSVAALRWIA
jgi:serine/threonine protein phosphatase PrpC